MKSGRVQRLLEGEMNMTEKDKRETIANLKRAIAEKAKDLPLQPGNYILTRDVTNPFPDKRKKYDWRGHAVWKSGTEFVVTEHAADIEFEGESIPAPYFQLAPRGGSSYRLDVRRPTEANDTDALKLLALAGSFQKVEAQRLGDIFTGKDKIAQNQAVHLLALLFEEEKVSMTDLRKLAKKLHEMESADYNALKERNGL